jgi:hypothetical protein
MASLYISEYRAQPIDYNGSAVPVGQEPSIATQKISISGTSAQSAAFQSTTRFIRAHTDAICSVAFGLNPTATASDARMVAGQTEFWGVAAGQKVAVITNT